MPDDRFFPEDDKLPENWPRRRPKDNENADGDVPASVIFTEMMRQAATKRQQDAFPPDDDFLSDWPKPPAFDPTQFDNPAPSTSAPSDLQAPAERPPTPRRRPSRAERAQSAAPPAEALPAPETTNDEQLEVQRIRRVKRRKEQRRRRTVGTLGGFLRSMFLVLLTAGLAATIFTYFTDPSFFGKRVVAGLQVANATSQATVQPTSLPATPNWLKTIGIVSGHRGPENDPGAVCPDGLTEASINFSVAQLVVNNLRERGYDVDLLDEFDPRLDNYQAAALVSIHANTCQDFGERVSGYLVAKAAARPEGGPDVILAECVAQHYEAATTLERRFSLTVDMTNYHSFREIHPLTPAAIIELGFMKDDRILLTEDPSRLARGITDGILCFLEPATPILTPQAAATP